MLYHQGGKGLEQESLVGIIISKNLDTSGHLYSMGVLSIPYPLSEGLGLFLYQGSFMLSQQDPFFSLKVNGILHMCFMHISFLCSPIHEHLYCFHVLSFVNNAAINLNEPMSL